MELKKTIANYNKHQEQHPFWGYRRVWATLKHKHGMLVKQKRILRIMNEQKLLVNRKEYKVKRSVLRPKPCAVHPNEYWENPYLQRLDLFDHSFRLVYEEDCGAQSSSSDWLAALDMGCNIQFPDGVRGQGLHLISDNGCLPTSKVYIRMC